MNISKMELGNDHGHAGVGQDQGEHVQPSDQMEDLMEELLIMKRMLYNMDDRLARIEQVLLCKEVRKRPSEDNDQPPPKRSAKSRLGVKGRLG